MNILDLFCGAGGLSRGFIDAGFKVLIGVDHDDAALQTFEKNHNGGIAFKADLSDYSFLEEIEPLLKGESVDVIVGGPPCQGFSLTGPRDFDDPRNKLYLAMHAAVRKYSPKAFVVENVTGLARLYKGEIRKKIVSSFEELGYSVKSEILTAADFGVPQIRKRIFFVGIKNDLKEFDFPEKTHIPETYIGCLEAIGDLPSRIGSIGKDRCIYRKTPFSSYQKIMRNGSKELFNHVGTNHTELVKSVIALVPEGGNHKDLPEGVGESRKFNEAWTRYHSKKPSKTIDTGHRNHFHYKWNRVPTVRENARLQSFKDDFIFIGNKTQQNRQVGNAVPPLLAYHVAKEIKKIIL
jgi:DNA (cytosine-5)-methyltransferase 1